MHEKNKYVVLSLLYVYSVILAHEANLAGDGELGVLDDVLVDEEETGGEGDQEQGEPSDLLGQRVAAEYVWQAADRQAGQMVADLVLELALQVGLLRQRYAVGRLTIFHIHVIFKLFYLMVLRE